MVALLGISEILVVAHAGRTLCATNVNVVASTDQLLASARSRHQARRVALLRHDAAGAGLVAFGQQDQGSVWAYCCGHVGDQRAERQRARCREACDFGAAVDRRNLVGVERISPRASNPSNSASRGRSTGKLEVPSAAAPTATSSVARRPAHPLGLALERGSACTELMSERDRLRLYLGRAGAADHARPLSARLTPPHSPDRRAHAASLRAAEFVAARCSSAWHVELPGQPASGLRSCSASTASSRIRSMPTRFRRSIWAPSCAGLTSAGALTICTLDRRYHPAIRADATVVPADRRRDDRHIQHHAAEAQSLRAGVPARAGEHGARPRTDLSYRAHNVAAGMSDYKPFINPLQGDQPNNVCANCPTCSTISPPLMKTLVFNEERALAEVERRLFDDHRTCRHVAARRRRTVPRRAIISRRRW